MDIKKITMFKYLARTTIFAVPGGALIGYFTVTHTQNLLSAVIFSGFMSGLLGIAISTKNFRQLIAPMKTIMEDLDALIIKSSIKLTSGIHTITDVKKALMLILQDLTGNLKKMAVEINQNSNRLVEFSNQTVSGAMTTASAISEVAASVQQVSANSQQIAENSETTAGFAREGSEGIGRIAAQMEIIQKTASQSGEVILGLNDSAQKISQIIDIITQIAEQTNLLALNAAIEAARAGDYGRGFAVVADEVRSLAEQSAGAAKKIYDLIKQTQHETEQAVLSTKESIGQVENGLRVVGEVAATFEKIIDFVQNLAEDIQPVTAATEEISSAILNVSDIADKQSSLMEQVADTARGLNDLAQKLNELYIRFDISQS
ncbi:methyl-accepting chemotaxis protein [Desulfotruncus alcoholivorax]|uniref:methyl-accepting chemotaxis protein n=1 Tax=Desulfotruncus alcoholivorax TaxID=265477 RepID=UPI0003F7F58C|nr:methyl-accepting chemotaxis protein [Desulfotruncus alcoholivorax]